MVSWLVFRLIRQMGEFLPGTNPEPASSLSQEGFPMTSNEHLPITEEVEEVRARSEDRLIDLVVPRLDHLAEVVTDAAEHLRERFTRKRAH
jgi:hypothetical protein